MHTAPNTSEQPDSDLTLADANELDLDAVFSRLNATAEGLSSTEVVTRRARFGPNALRSHGASRWRIFASQLRNPLLILLLAAAAVSAGTGDVTDAAIITVIVSMSVGLGFFNEYRSEQAVQALHDSMRHTTTVTRDGAPSRSMPSASSQETSSSYEWATSSPPTCAWSPPPTSKCDESVLTGESMPTTKSTAQIAAGHGLQELASCAFMGTIVDRSPATWPMVVALLAPGKARADEAERANLVLAPAPLAAAARVVLGDRVLVIRVATFDEALVSLR